MLTNLRYSTQAGTYSLAMQCGAVTTRPATNSYQGVINCSNTVSGSTVGASNSMGGASPDHTYNFTVTDYRATVTFNSCTCFHSCGRALLKSAYVC